MNLKRLQVLSNLENPQIKLLSNVTGDFIKEGGIAQPTIGKSIS